MNETPTRTWGARRLGVVLLVAFVWPPVYLFFVHPYANTFLASQTVSNAEIQKLLNVRRYTLHVPGKRDEWILSLEGVVDGKAEWRGGSSVQGGSDIVLLVRQIMHTDEIEYCWYDGKRVSYGVIDDPLKNAGASTQRGEGRVEPGDWLLRGGRTSVSSSERAEFEVRVALRPPNNDTETEPPHPTEPAVGSDSSGKRSAPAR